jgi:hypothetical protein
MKVTHVDGSVTEWHVKHGTHSTLLMRANGGAWHVAYPKALAPAAAAIRGAISATEALAVLDASAFDAVDLANEVF